MPQLGHNCNHLGKHPLLVHNKPMTKPESAASPSQQALSQRAQQRRKRQAAALRANLRRRKEGENGGAEPGAEGNSVQNDPDLPNT
jgi:hypothetical protein